MKAIRRPLFWFNLAMWFVSIVIAFLLIQLGGLIMSDVPTAGKKISRDDFVNQVQLDKIEKQIEENENKSQNLLEQIEDARFRLNSVSLDYNNQRSTFESWVKTRTATEQDSQNSEVLKRVAVIEKIKVEQRKAQKALEALQQQEIDNKRQLRALSDSRYQTLGDAEPAYEKALAYETLKVALLRLALVLPLVAISGWLVLKKRGSKYWPVYRGFILFTLFAFFFELIPYLPTYGGYLRYGVGIILALAVAHYAIKGMERYLKRKKSDQEKPESEKRREIGYETAVKKISSGICPSCDRQFTTQKLTKSKLDEADKVDYCMHCGFCLHNQCGTCGNRKNSFYHFCGNCGSKAESAETA